MQWHDAVSRLWTFSHVVRLKDGKQMYFRSRNLFSGPLFKDQRGKFHYLFVSWKSCVSIVWQLLFFTMCLWHSFQFLKTAEPTRNMSYIYEQEALKYLSVWYPGYCAVLRLVSRTFLKKKENTGDEYKTFQRWYHFGLFLLMAWMYIE